MVNVKAIVSGLVLGIVGIVIIFYLVGNLSPTITTAATNISDSGLPLASLFSSSGVVMIVFMAAILLAVIGLAMGFAKMKGS